MSVLLAVVAAMALALASLPLVVSAARADHEDVIAEKIPIVEGAFELELLADGFGVPVWGAAAPYNSKQLFVVGQFGQVTAVRLNPNDEQVPERYTFLDVGPQGLDLLTPPPGPDDFDERGLVGLAFHPRYRKNGLLYTYTSEPLGPEPAFTNMGDDVQRDRFSGSLSVIREWRVNEPRRLDAVVNPESSRVLLTIEQPKKNHNAGALVFGPDAMLYIALGDGGSSDDQGLGHPPGGNGQDLSENNLLGKILRIDPLGSNGLTGEYGVPADNPFVDAAGPDEAFAYGFRNPWRMAFDHGTGDLIAADVGQRDIEEVDLVQSGGNYGWPVKEGTFLFNANGPNQKGYSGDDSPGVPEDMIDPIAQYDHDEGTSITGGFVYRGAAIPDLFGSYVFGDFTADGDGLVGRFFEVDSGGALREIVPTNHDDNRMLIFGFGQDTEGELYVMGSTRDGGSVFKLVPAG